MNRILPLLLIIIGFACETIETSESIVQKSIAFHDPNNQWSDLKAKLNVKLVMPNGPDRLSEIELDRANDYFKLTEVKESDTLIRIMDEGKCQTLMNGIGTLNDELKKQHRLRCEDAQMYRDYYTYLYGLPMKLLDEGTIIDPIFEKVPFNDKDYLRVRVTYKKEVGEDTWYFYFDPATYAMEVYQFYHDESKNDGEYILLEELEQIGQLKLPKTRHWFVNKDDRLLGTDILVDITVL